MDNIRLFTINFLSQNGLMSTVNPFPSALNALHQMKSFGLNIKIVMNHDLIGEKVEWIATKLGADWRERIIVINVSNIVDTSVVKYHKSIGSSTTERRLFY